MKRDMAIASYWVEEKETSATIWVQFEARNAIAPVCYLRKPKWLTTTQWGRITASIKIDADRGILIQYDEDDCP